MNNSTQAQKGFKTFLLTLSVSLIIFSAVYYLLTNVSGDKDGLAPEITVEAESSGGDTSMNKETSVFGQLAAQEMNNPGRAVLAGATSLETTQSTTTVPDTGVTNITLGLVSAGILFIAGLYVISKDPRKLAIASFERKITRRL